MSTVNLGRTYLYTHTATVGRYEWWWGGWGGSVVQHRL